MSSKKDGPVEKALAFMIDPLSRALDGCSIYNGRVLLEESQCGARTEQHGWGLHPGPYLTGVHARPLGLRPGVWGLIVCTALYVFVSLGTGLPAQKAEDSFTI